MDAEKTGKLIRELRTEKGLTQQELASLLKVSPTAVSKWENGKNLPDITLLEQLADAFGVSCSDIILGRVSNEAEAGAENSGTEAAVRSVIEASAQQRKKKARKSIILTVILLTLLSAVLYYYFHDEPVRDLGGHWSETIDLQTFHTVNLINNRSITEIVDLEFDLNDLKYYMSGFGPDAVRDLKVEQIWLIMSSPDSSLHFDGDHLLKDEMGDHYGFYEGTLREPEMSEDGRYSIRLNMEMYHTGTVDHDTETMIQTSVWIKVTYRKDYPFSRRYSVLFRTGTENSLVITPDPK